MPIRRGRYSLHTVSHNRILPGRDQWAERNPLRVRERVRLKEDEFLDLARVGQHIEERHKPPERVPEQGHGYMALRLAEDFDFPHVVRHQRTNGLEKHRLQLAAKQFAQRHHVLKSKARASRDYDDRLP
ncbi:MAG: hypothetical protein ACI80V_001627 [Rhodothermales bacterium]|jgi:hypothetical protein